MNLKQKPEAPRTLKILQPDVIGYSAAIHSCKVACGSLGINSMAD